MSQWNQPICERDWIEQNAEWDGNRMLSLRMPARLTAEHIEVETCSYCGEPTIFGVYKRDDPATVPYPPAAAASGPGEPT